MGMSKYTRFKLRAHDLGEDRHNKGVSYLKKKSRLNREHQTVISQGKRQRAVRVQSRREMKGREWVKLQRIKTALEEMSQGLLDAAGVDRGRLVQFLESKPKLAWPAKTRYEVTPVIVHKTYRVRQAGSEEVELVEGEAVKGTVRTAKPM